MRAVGGRQQVRLRLGQGAVGHEDHAPQPQRLAICGALALRLPQLHIFHHDAPAHAPYKIRKTP
jgi:hypothetical protein